MGTSAIASTNFQFIKKQVPAERALEFATRKTNDALTSGDQRTFTRKKTIDGIAVNETGLLRFTFDNADQLLSPPKMSCIDPLNHSKTYLKSKSHRESSTKR